MVAVMAAALVAGCKSTQSDPPAATSASDPYFPYPPQHDTLEIAVPVDPLQSEAAQFALEVRQATTFASYSGPDDVNRYNSMMAEQLKGSFLGIPRPQRTTGGETYRVVRATTRPADAVEVDVCTYASPGVYGLQSGETRPHLIQNPDGYGITRLTVQKTTAKSATGQIATEPRWLAVEYDLALSFNMAESDRLCAPFRPQPWVQKMPDPTDKPTATTK